MFCGVLRDGRHPLHVPVGLSTAARIIRDTGTTRGVDASKVVAAQFGGERLVEDDLEN